MLLFAGSLASRRTKPREHINSMKKTPKRDARDVNDIRQEYRFDYGQAKPNRFAAAVKGSAMAGGNCALVWIKQYGGDSSKQRRRPSRSA